MKTRMPLICFFSVVMAVLPLLAKDKKLPPPPVFFEAKTITIVNTANVLYLSDAAYSELSKFKNYRYVHNQDEADLVLVISTVDPVLISPGQPVSINQSSASVNVNTANSLYYNPGQQINEAAQNLNNSLARLAAINASRPIFKSGWVYTSIFSKKETEPVWKDARKMGKEKNNKNGVKSMVAELRKRVEGK